MCSHTHAPSSHKYMSVYPSGHTQVSLHIILVIFGKNLFRNYSMQIPMNYLCISSLLQNSCTQISGHVSLLLLHWCLQPILEYSHIVSCLKRLMNHFYGFPFLSAERRCVGHLWFKHIKWDSIISRKESPMFTEGMEKKMVPVPVVFLLDARLCHIFTVRAVTTFRAVTTTWVNMFLPISRAVGVHTECSPCHYNLYHWRRLMSSTYLWLDAIYTLSSSV